MATKLISKSDISAVRQISNSLFDDVLNEQIDDAQFVDIQKLLGDDFYNDLLLNNQDTNYQTLLNGGTYTYQSVTYTNVGLKIVIVNYTMSRMYLNAGHLFTPFGLHQKTNISSEPVDFLEKKSRSKALQQMAFKKWENVRKFLDRSDSGTYPLWEESCIFSRNTFRISKIV